MAPERRLQGYSFAQMQAPAVPRRTMQALRRLNEAKEVYNRLRVSRDPCQDYQRLAVLRDQRERVFALIRQSNLPVAWVADLRRVFLPAVLEQIRALGEEMEDWEEEVEEARLLVEDLEGM